MRGRYRSVTRWLRTVPGLLLLTASAAYSEPLGQAGSNDVSLGRVAGALALCLALAVGAAFALRSQLSRQRWPQIAGRRMQLVETLRLGGQSQVHLVCLDRREFIVVTTPHGTELGPMLPSGAEMAPEA